MALFSNIYLYICLGNNTFSQLGYVKLIVTENIYTITKELYYE